MASPTNAEERAFGIAMGTPIGQLTVSKKMAVEGGFQVVPPIPNDYFTTYSVVATPTEGVCSVSAIGPPKSERGDPSRARLLVTFMTRELTAIYGPPTSAATTQEALVKGFEPFGFWDRATSKSGSISMDIMNIDGLSLVTLTYTFSNFDKCIETIGKADVRRARRGL